jgi:hypothetical protein
MKTCKDCGDTKDEGDFTWINSTTRTPYMCNSCKSCKAAYARKYRKTPAGQKSRVDSVRLRRYGMGKGEYERRLIEQGNACFICLKPCKSGKRLAVDHNHITGKVRGLLCYSCNTGLGHFLADNGPETLLRAVAYIQRDAGVITAFVI